TGDLEKAINIFQDMNAKYPNDPDVLFDLAMVFEEKGDLKNAVESLQKLVKLDPNHPQAFFYLGKDTILMGDAEKAITRYLLKALSIHTQLGDQRGEADVLNAMGVAYERLGRYDDAIRYYNDSIAVKEKIGNKKGVATSLNNIAKIQVFQGEYDKAQEVMKRALQIFEELEDVQGIAGAMNMFGVIHEDRGNYAEALRYYKAALKNRKDLGNDQQTAQSYDNIGQIYYLMGQNDNAQVYWEQALALRKTIGEESGLILSLQNMGVLQMAQGRLDNALKSFMEALDRSRSIKYENAIAVSLGNLGTVYQIQGRYAGAEESYRQAIQILDKLKDKKGVAEYTKLLGSIFLELNNLPRANAIFDRVHDMAQEIGSTEILTDTLILQSHGSLLAGQHEKARKQLEEAFRNATKFGYQRALVRSRIEQGLLLAAESKPEDARTVLSSALKTSMELSDARLIIDSNHALAAHALISGDYRSAIQLCEKAIGAAKKMEARPHLFRLYSIAGQAYLHLNHKQKALESFRKGASVVEEIKKAANPEHVSDLMRMREVQTINELK
ncbi:MAG TPA: tetratricopeptide repeat protein, partial [Acidobacteriota bacterium]|nr:tetratricopeptide repeat protein [Acidobacteriota bacterium]